jgi:hypothetical protein
MGVRSRCLASLLALLAAAGAARADEPPPPTPPEQRASDAIEQYRALRAAYEAERWQEVLDRVAACFEPSIGLSARRFAVAMAATAARRLEMWETCIQYCRAYADLAKKTWPPTEDEDWDRVVVCMEADSLLHLDRFRDAEERLDWAAARLPELREYPRWQWLRRLARPQPALEFEPCDSEDPIRQKRRVEGMHRLKEAFPRAVARLRARLGSGELALPPIRVLAVESEAAESEDTDDGFIASASVVRRGTGWVGLIRVRCWFIEYPTGEDERMLAHELAHVLHLSGTENRHPPDWLAEGLAHWLEAEDDSAHRRKVFGRTMSRLEHREPSVSWVLQSPETLATADHDSQRFGGTALFFQLERGRGLTAHRRLVGRLLKDPDHQTVLQEETGLEMGELLAQVRRGHSKWEEAAFPGVEEVSRAMRLAQDKRFAESVAVLDGLLAGTVEPALRAEAELVRLDTLIESGDFLSARKALGPILYLRRSRPMDELVPRGLAMELQVLLGSEDWEGVVAFAREFVDSLWQDDAEFREELEECLALAEKHLAEAAAPK